MPLRIWRILTLLGRPPGLAGGINGSRMAHSASERSLAEGFIGDRSSSLSASFSFICFYCITFFLVGSSSPTGSPGLLVQPLGSDFEGNLKPLMPMRTANLKHGNIGDIEIILGDSVIEAWDAKYATPYLSDALDELVDNIRNRNVS